MRQVGSGADGVHSLSKGKQLYFEKEKHARLEPVAALKRLPNSSIVGFDLLSALDTPSATL